ncbi:hypothetical protein WJ96_04670 [Burkholderia ubonensis]|uniref:Protein-tyrosine-phosphatase n=1 Tax=Burkholderia ubonensis TaxID=101571 RepID=A0AAW3MXC6_9BURK|nr:hypothetical protein WJ93_24405 [Burkholderia ubonensis]KVP96523.1 hypothetical protein WJ97_11600 [Burkholderia ubonensis]KVP97866.1 hypothetical protein WJ96_04670 [Burkholderia ubonensis]KVZ92563.1 hypothetical protein WL25_16325 [Burkholderia ubonensis]
MRSRTAELLCLFGGVHARSAGSDKDADVPLNDALIRQASLIVCMEKQHHEALKEFQHYGNCPSVLLGIPDQFDRLQDELVRDLIFQARFHDAALAEAMERGAALLAAQPGYRNALGTRTPRVFGNNAYDVFPQ